MKRASGGNGAGPDTNNAGAAAKALTINDILVKARNLWTRKNIANVVHWVAVISAAAVSIGTTVFIPGGEKVAGYGIAVSLISLAQVIHKFTDALDHQQTLTQAVEATLPAIEAATTGNEHQLNALEKEIHR